MSKYTKFVMKPNVKDWHPFYQELFGLDGKSRDQREKASDVMNKCNVASSVLAQ